MVTKQHLLDSAPSMYGALWAIANMQIQEETDKGEVLALCMSIARVELEKVQRLEVEAKRSN